MRRMSRWDADGRSTISVQVSVEKLERERVVGGSEFNRLKQSSLEDEAFDETVDSPTLFPASLPEENACAECPGVKPTASPR